MDSENNSPQLTIADILARLSDYPDFCEPLTDINQIGTFGNRPLHLVSWQGNVEEIRTLVEGGADVNVIGDMGATPLHEAAQAGHADAVRFLLERGAKSNIKDELGHTPLDWALLNGHVEVAKVLECSSGSRSSS